MYLSRTTSYLAVAIDCEWGSWTIKDCSTSCGQGTRTKTRSVKVKAAHGGKCPGKRTMKEDCNLKKCPSKFSMTFFSAVMYLNHLSSNQGHVLHTYH